jgi:hypothetical protein
MKTFALSIFHRKPIMHQHKTTNMEDKIMRKKLFVTAYEQQSGVAPACVDEPRLLVRETVPRSFEERLITLKIVAVRSFETSRSNYPSTWRSNAAYLLAQYGNRFATNNTALRCAISIWKAASFPIDLAASFAAVICLSLALHKGKELARCYYRPFAYISMEAVQNTSNGVLSLSHTHKHT